VGGRGKGRVRDTDQGAKAVTKLVFVQCKEGNPIQMTEVCAIICLDDIVFKPPARIFCCHWVTRNVTG